MNKKTYLPIALVVLVLLLAGCKPVSCLFPEKKETPIEKKVYTAEQKAWFALSESSVLRCKKQEEKRIIHPNTSEVCESSWRKIELENSNFEIDYFQKIEFTHLEAFSDLNKSIIYLKANKWGVELEIDSFRYPQKCEHNYKENKDMGIHRVNRILLKEGEEITIDLEEYVRKYDIDTRSDRQGLNLSISSMGRSANLDYKLSFRDSEASE